MQTKSTKFLLWLFLIILSMLALSNCRDEEATTPTGQTQGQSTAAFTEAERKETSTVATPTPEEITEQLMPTDTPDPNAGNAEFAIYLPVGQPNLGEQIDINQITLAEEPVLSVGDILSYDAATHAFDLKADAAGRLSELDLPGKLFVVAVGRESIYIGAFMAAYMSNSYDGVVILLPPMSQDDLKLQIQLGYPGADFFSGQDPRSTPVVLDALNHAGILH